MEDLAGRVIVITGAGSGIGAATALACARSGMHCILNDRCEGDVSHVARSVEALGCRAVIVAGNVAQGDMSSRLLDAAERDFGGFDAVFANAGFGIERSLLETPMDEVREIFEVNFFAGLELLRKAARTLIANQRPGHLFMCASCLAKFSYPMFGAYAATKAAQTQVCSSLRAELAPYRIEVSAVCPIVTRTAFFRAVTERNGEKPNGDCLPDYCPSFLVHEPERVAAAVVKCLRKPRAEVWTSTIMRLFAALVTLWPRPLELAARRQALSLNGPRRPRHVAPAMTNLTQPD